MSNIKIISTNSIIFDKKVAIYDAFYSNIKKCICLIFNPCYLCEDEVSKIKVFTKNGEELEEMPLIGSDVHHSRPCDYDLNKWTQTEINGCLYFEYKSENIIIKYEDKEKNVKIVNKEEKDEETDIMLSTLVHRPSYHGIESWIEYHKKYDIKNYSFYLNDFSEENVNDITNSVMRFDDININIVQWDFPYSGQLNNNFFHGAQIQSMNHAMHYFNNKSLVLTDVDEYVITKNLKDIINKYQDYAFVVMQNKWGKRTDKKEKFGVNQAVIYDSNRDNQIVKNIIIDRKKIKSPLVHGSCCYSEYKSEMLTPDECFFLHYLDYIDKKDRNLNPSIMGVFNEKIISI